MAPCDRSLRDYEGCDDPIMFDILSKTRYVSFDEFHVKLRALVLEHLPEGRFNLLLNSGKFGSEHWIAALLQDILEPRCETLVTYDRPIANNLPIVRIDDCMYSGHTSASQWDDMSYKRIVKNRCLNIVPFAVRRSDRDQHSILSQLETHVGEHVDPYFDAKEFDFYYDRYGCETDLVAPLYFDHKIAVAHCTFQFLHKWVKEPPCRDVVAEVEQCVALYLFTSRSEKPWDTTSNVPVAASEDSLVERSSGLPHALSFGFLGPF